MSEEEGGGDGPVLDIFGARRPPPGGSEAPAAPSATATTEPHANTELEAVHRVARAQAARDADDMFALDDDMFGERSGENLAAGGTRGGAAVALADAYDDQEGHYKFQVGGWVVQFRVYCLLCTCCSELDYRIAHAVLVSTMLKFVGYAMLFVW